MKDQFVTILALISILVVACNEGNQVSELRVGDLIAKGKISRDSTFDGTIEYYSLDKQLVRTEVYSKTLLNGMSTYYKDGVKYMERGYKSGEQYGPSFVYRQNGSKLYSDFYYYGLPVGPVVYFEESEVARLFFFLSLDNRTLCSIYYNSWEGISSHPAEFINFTAVLGKEDTAREIHLLLYLMNPPRIKIRYSLAKLKTGSTDAPRIIADLEGPLPFIQKSLPDTLVNEQYIVTATIFDSVVGKHSIIYKAIDTMD